MSHLLRGIFASDTPAKPRMGGYPPVLFMSNLKYFNAMVKIISYKAVQNKEGKEFYALTLMGGIEAVKSSNGNYYLTAKKASIPSTFSEEICMGLIGQTLDGEIVKIPCEPYSFNSKSTGEEITLDFRYGYQENKALPVQNDLDKEIRFLPANVIPTNMALA